MVAKPKRHWYQFSLRAMFVVMILASMIFGYWVHWSKEWIRQRHEALSNEAVADFSYASGRPTAPGGLWIFGEEGVDRMMVRRHLGADYEKDQKNAASLFPEAELIDIWRGPVEQLLRGRPSNGSGIK